ncbi:MAG TPA: EVE domain-containing protein, partial [Candidatus Eisenbacteria bacterium]
DPKSGDPRAVVVDLAADKPLPKPVTLAQAKADAVLKTSDLARLPRLSVMPLSEAQFQRLLRLAGA